MIKKNALNTESEMMLRVPAKPSMPSIKFILLVMINIVKQVSGKLTYIGNCTSHSVKNESIFISKKKYTIMPGIIWFPALITAERGKISSLKPRINTKRIENSRNFILPKRSKGKNTTAVSNAAIDEIWRLVRDGTPIEIRP